MKSRRRSRFAAFGAVANSFSGAKRARTKTYRSSIRAGTGTHTAAGQSRSLTVQSDAVVDFRPRRRRRNKRVIKRVKRFRRKVSNVITSQYPSNRVLCQSVSRLVSADGQTAASTYTLYGADGTRDPNVNPTSDLRHLFIESLSGIGYGTHTGTVADKAAEFDQLTDNTSPNGTFRSDLADPQIYFSKALMETTFRNTGLNDVIVEVYQFICRRTVLGNINAATFSPGLLDPAQLYHVGFDKMHTIQSTVPASTSGTGHVNMSAPIAYTDVGSTPFQSSLFTKYFKIVKRTRYRLASSSEASFVNHFPKKFRLTGSSVRGRMALKGITMGILFQIQGSPYVTGVTVPHIAATAEITITNIRHYNIQYYPGITGKGSANITADVYQAA